MRALVRIARLVDENVIRNVESIGAGRELFSRGALELAPGEVPLLVNHDGARVAGRVFEIAEREDVGGWWAFARCELDDAPAWVKHGTPASFGFASIGTRQTLGAGWERVNRALLTEVSLLGPGVEPFELGARVVALVESPPLPAGEILEAGGVGRRYCGGVVSVR